MKDFIYLSLFFLIFELYLSHRVNTIFIFYLFIILTEDLNMYIINLTKTFLIDIYNFSL